MYGDLFFLQGFISFQTFYFIWLISCQLMEIGIYKNQYTLTSHTYQIIVKSSKPLATRDIVPSTSLLPKVWQITNKPLVLERIVLCITAL